MYVAVGVQRAQKRPDRSAGVSDHIGQLPAQARLPVDGRKLLDGVGRGASPDG